MSSDEPSIDEIWAMMNTEPTVIKRKPDAVPGESIIRDRNAYKKADHEPIPNYETIEHALNALNVAAPKHKIRALESIIAFVDEMDRDQVDAIMDDVMKTVLKRATDKTEKCRTRAIYLLLRLCDKCSVSSVLECLPLVVPVLRYRLAESSTTARERSDDLRAELLQLIQLLLRRCETSLSPYFSEFLVVLSCSLGLGADGGREQDAACLSAACRCLSLLCPVSPQRIQPHANALVLALLPLFLHKKAAVRLAVVQCVRVLVHHGASETIRELCAFRESNVVPIKAFYEGERRRNVFASLVQDRNANVRRAFYQTVHDWRLTLKERLDYETLLMPYMLSALSDPLEDIQLEGLQAVEQLGEQYEQEHEEDLLDQKRFSHLLPSNICQDTRAPILPPPFQRRARLGEKIVVGAQVGRLLPALVQEVALEDGWESQAVERAALLLCTLCFYAEERVSAHVELLLRALLRLYARPPASTAARYCCRLLARHNRLHIYLPLLVHSLEYDEDAVPAMRIAAECVEELSAEEVLTHHQQLLDAFVLRPDVKESHNMTLRKLSCSIGEVVRKTIASKQETSGVEHDNNSPLSRDEKHSREGPKITENVTTTTEAKI